MVLVEISVFLCPFVKEKPLKMAKMWKNLWFFIENIFVFLFFCALLLTFCEK